MPVLTSSSQAYKIIVDTMRSAIINPLPRVDQEMHEDNIPRHSTQFTEGRITLNIKRLSLNHCLQLHTELQENHPLHSIYGKLNMTSIVSTLQEQAIKQLLAMHPYRNDIYQDVIIDYDRYPIETSLHLLAPLLYSMESGYTVHYRALKECIRRNAPPISFMEAMQKDLETPAKFKRSPAFARKSTLG